MRPEVGDGDGETEWDGETEPLGDEEAEGLREAEVEDEDSLLECDDQEYDFSQISVSKVYDGATVSVDRDRNGDTTEVNAEVRLKYADKDTEEKCYARYDISVTFEDGEDPELEYELQE